MAPSKFLNLLALFSLAIIATSYVAVPANALSIDTSHNVVRREHAALAKKKRSTSTKRCKPRAATTTPVAKSTPKPDPTTTSSSKAATPTPSTGSVKTVKGGKIGLAWPNGDDPILSKWAVGNTNFLYTWSAFIPSNDFGLTPVPMLWGPSKLDEFKKLVKPGYATHCLGFNEPDIPSQSNLDPGTAAGLWKQYLNPLVNDGYTLISPATVTGTKWMHEFLTACNGGCHFNITAVHFYGTKFADLQKTLEAYHNEFGKPVWLTEVACQSFTGGAQCNQGQVYDLMNQLKAYANENDWLQQMFWFGSQLDMTNVNPLNQLMSPNKMPNALGNNWLF